MPEVDFGIHKRLKNSYPCFLQFVLTAIDILGVLDKKSLAQALFLYILNPRESINVVHT